MEKKEIRKLIFQRRKSADAEILKANSDVICKKIMESEAFQSAGCIYVYMDYKGEVSMRPLLETSWRMKKKVAAPKVTGPGEMTYYYIQSYDDVAPGYFRIPEPVTQIEAREESALLIVPGVAFDRRLHRCGYGQGFYDRYLAAHREHPTIAVAFDFQIVEEVPAGAYDVLPQVLITEKEVFFL